MLVMEFNLTVSAPSPSLDCLIELQKLTKDKTQDVIINLSYRELCPQVPNVVLADTSGTMSPNGDQVF